MSLVLSIYGHSFSVTHLSSSITYCFTILQVVCKLLFLGISAIIIEVKGDYFYPLWGLFVKIHRVWNNLCDYFISEIVVRLEAEPSVHKEVSLGRSMLVGQKLQKTIWKLLMLRKDVRIRCTQLC